MGCAVSLNMYQENFSKKCTIVPSKCFSGATPYGGLGTSLVETVCRIKARQMCVNVTLTCFRVTVVAVETQICYIF